MTDTKWTAGPWAVIERPAGCWTLVKARGRYATRVFARANPTREGQDNG